MRPPHRASPRAVTRFLALLAAALTMTTLAGCSTPNTATTSTSDEVSAEEPITPSPDPDSDPERTTMPHAIHPALTIPEAFTQVSARTEHHDAPRHCRPLPVWH